VSNSNNLKGSLAIPEASTEPDQFAEPKMPPPDPAVSTWGEQYEREKRWKQHLRAIERNGQRFDPDGPKHGDGIY